ncbi:unnamed protein product [Timema podura]|uniref:Uncharacterized protein n=1 Tax=Timema podura TaxID=61482 RepID=A0ABN7NJQ7_TIMPD|nr:unnamed protein product [Timema podura]
MFHYLVPAHRRPGASDRRKKTRQFTQPRFKPRSPRPWQSSSTQN